MNGVEKRKKYFSQCAEFPQQCFDWRGIVLQFEKIGI